jgi:hypothetical protein
MKEPVLTGHAKQWNDHHCQTKGLTGQERKLKLLAYAKRIRNQTPVAIAEPRLWASVIKTRIADGELLPAICLKLANDALNIIEVEI